MSKWVGLCVVFAAMMSLAACGGAGSSKGSYGQGSLPQVVDILAHDHGNDAALVVPMVKLINTADELAALGSQNLETIPIDFQTQSLVVFSMGEQPSGGYWARITGLQIKDGVLYVQGLANAPGKGAMATMQLTYPYAAVTAPKVRVAEVLSDITSAYGQKPPKG